MKNILAGLSIEKKLGAAALALGFFALFGANPYDHTYTTVNTKDIAFATETKTGMVPAVELADWLIKGKSDFRLVDLRSLKDYNEYHIPQAQNYKVPELNQPVFTRTEKIVLYSETDVEAAQAWFLLKSKDYKAVYILKGGMQSWKEQILFPKLALNASAAESAEFEKIKEISKFFGGTPQSGIKGDSLKPGLVVPKLQTPVQSVKGKQQVKKKEGC